MTVFKREIAIFAGLFFLLALAVHFKAWFSHPMTHIARLPESPMGPLHPLVLTLAAYFVLLMLRLMFRVAKSMLSRGER